MNSPLKYSIKKYSKRALIEINKAVPKENISFE